jgi:hypothetical protein
MPKAPANNPVQWYRRKLVIASGIAVVLFASLYLQVPSNVGPWNETQTRIAWVEFSGRKFTVHNVRDFRYNQDRTVVSPDYSDQDYNLDALKNVWFGLSHFGPFGLAHSFVSFEFHDGDQPRYLVLSVEGRLRPDQRYKPLVGLMRRYTKISIFATEQDAIGLRSHVRGERVLLYPASTPPQILEHFFLALVGDANELREAPEFYNTVLDNCLTNLLKHASQIENISFTDLRVLLPGRTDRLTYALDITPTNIPFDEARQRATINPALSGIDDPDFSASLRCGWNECL